MSADAALWRIAIVVGDVKVRDLTSAIRCKSYQDETRQTVERDQALQLRSRVRTLFVEALECLRRSACQKPEPMELEQMDPMTVIAKVLQVKTEAAQASIEEDVCDMDAIVM